MKSDCHAICLVMACAILVVRSDTDAYRQHIWQEHEKARSEWRQTSWKIDPTVRAPDADRELRQRNQLLFSEPTKAEIQEMHHWLTAAAEHLAHHREPLDVSESVLITGIRTLEQFLKVVEAQDYAEKLPFVDQLPEHADTWTTINTISDLLTTSVQMRMKHHTHYRDLHLEEAFMCAYGRYISISLQVPSNAYRSPGVRHAVETLAESTKILYC